jgi:hypothetical protein
LVFNEFTAHAPPGGKKGKGAVSNEFHTEIVVRSLSGGKKRQIVSSRFRTELTVHALARDEKGIEAVSSEFCTKSIVQTHFLVLRREGRRSVIGFAMSSQFTHLLEARKGKEQSVMSFIQ